MHTHCVCSVVLHCPLPSLPLPPLPSPPSSPSLPPPEHCGGVPALGAARCGARSSSQGNCPRLHDLLCSDDRHLPFLLLWTLHLPERPCTGLLSHGEKGKGVGGGGGGGGGRSEGCTCKILVLFLPTLPNCGIWSVCVLPLDASDQWLLQ